MEARKRRKPSKTFSHKQNQFVFKKKKNNYSIPHNFYDQKLCLNHNNYNEKPATTFFWRKTILKMIKQTRTKKMAGQKLKKQETYKDKTTQTKHHSQINTENNNNKWKFSSHSQNSQT